MAADDILRGEKQITDVASDHGFDNESYFFRLFKKKYGITPLKYRQNQFALNRITNKSLYLSDLYYILYKIVTYNGSLHCFLSKYL